MLVSNKYFYAGATAHSNAYFGEGRGPVHLDYIQCSGRKYNLIDCTTANSTRQTNHSQDVGVKCQPGKRVYLKGRQVNLKNSVN